MQAVSVGPWMFAVGVVALVLGLVAALAVAAFLRHRGEADAGNSVWWLLLASLVVARVVFLVRFWPAYSDSFWSIIDIRDGGFSPLGGAICLLLVTAVWALCQPRLRLTLTASVGSGVLVWALVSVTAAHLESSAHPPLPDASFTRLGGDDVRLTEWQGKPMVINLWATWCGPCRREMPMLVDASRKVEGVRFVFANQGESARAVAGWLDQEELSPAYVLLDGRHALSQHYHAKGYPTTLFVDASGHLQDTQIGMLTAARLRAHLQQIQSTEKE